MNYGTLGKNAVLYSIGTIAIRTASFLLIPVYTYSLSVTEYGLLSVLLQTAQILVIVIGLGSRTALVRFAREYEDKHEVGCLIGTTIFINLLGTVLVTAVCASVLIPLFQHILHATDVLGYVLLTCAAATSNCLAYHLMAYYRAEHKSVQVTIANLAAAVALIAVTATFVRVMRWGIMGALLAQALIYGLLAVFFVVNIWRKVELRISLPLTARLIRFGLPLIFVSVGVLGTNTSALYFLSYFHSLAEVGVYSLAYKLAAIPEMVLILPFQMAYEPFVYGQDKAPRLWDAISRLLTYLMMAFTFLACSILFMTRDLLPLVAPSAFSRAHLITFLILPSLAFKGVYYIGESLLFLEKRTATAGAVVTCFSLFSVGLNYLLISKWGMYGASAVNVFTTVCIGAVAMKIGLKMAPVHPEASRLTAVAILLFAFLASMYVLNGASAFVYYFTGAAVVCVGTLALFAGGFVRDDEKRVLQLILKREAYGQ